jgi:hypothetical protein
MGFIFGLNHWKHLLAGTLLPVQVFIDHANLTYYRHPQKISCYVARYINDLLDYHFKLKHIVGTANRADALSWWPDYDDGLNDNEDVVALLDHLFLCQVSTMTLWKRVSHTNTSLHIRSRTFLPAFHFIPKTTIGGTLVTLSLWKMISLGGR